MKLNHAIGRNARPHPGSLPQERVSQPVLSLPYWLGIGLCGLVAGCAGDRPSRQPQANGPTGFAPMDAKAMVDPTNTPAAAQSVALQGVPIKNELSPELLQPNKAAFTLGPGDAIDVEIIGNPTSRALTVVGLDGKIYYSLLPGLDVWGLTLEQTRELIQKELTKYISDAQVSLNLQTVGSKHVWVLGRLNKPGIYPLNGSMTLIESLGLAGGPAKPPTQVNSQELADLRHSFVVRQGQFLPVDFYRLLRGGDMTQNIYLQPDDFVYVPSALANEVYILGAVRTPRAINYEEGMSLVSAIANGDGPAQLEIFSQYDNGPFMKNAYLSHVAIVRGSLAQPQMIMVDANAVFKGRAPDVRLEPGDIVYVPNSPFTTFKRYFNIIANSFVTTVAANEGLRAAGQNVSVGVSIPVNVPTVATPPPVLPTH
jgi:polysaccharide export outer membrane protein